MGKCGQEEFVSTSFNLLLAGFFAATAIVVYAAETIFDFVSFVGKGAIDAGKNSNKDEKGEDSKQ